jgi:uncharacterized protein
LAGEAAPSGKNTVAAGSEPIGTVQLVRRYPVKGMAGEELNEVFVTFSGLVGDRVYAFYDPENKTDFPWMTPRIWEQMLLLQPKFVAPAVPTDERPAPENLRVAVTTPDGSSHDVTSETFRGHLERHFKRPIVLRFSERSMHDARPVSILGVKTLESLSTETGIAPDARRFRCNFLVDWRETAPFFEDSLVDRRIRIGEHLLMSVVKRNVRCKVMTLDPETAEAAPHVLETVARAHESRTGVYAVVLHEGIVRRGDSVFVD